MAAASSAPAVSSDAAKLRFDKFSKCFLKGEQRVPGLLDMLCTRFYPKYSFMKAKYNKDKNTSEHQRRKRSRAVDRREAGQQAGIRLDTEIERKIQVDNAPPGTFTAQEITQARQLRGDAKAFFHALARLELRPIQAQVPVEKTYRGRTVATAIDVVCLNKQEQYVLVECKRGFTSYYNCCTSERMAAPLNNFTDSLANQHQLQLASSRELYTHTFPDHPVAAAIILHVEDTKVTLHKLKPWVEAVESWIALLFD